MLRPGVRFHNGEPVTAQDVKFSFERYRGASHELMKDRVATVETPDGLHVRFQLKAPWPDFLTFYSAASGAGWIVPKKYVEQGRRGRLQEGSDRGGSLQVRILHPWPRIGLRGIRGLLAQVPAVKRLVFKVIPDESTRLAALQRGEIDVAYSIRGELAEQLQRTPGLTIKAAVGSAPFWLYFPEQWDAKSPWHDQRVRQAVSLAIDRKMMNEALTLGQCHLTGSVFPENFDFYWQPPQPQYDPARAKELLADAGFPNGFDAGDYNCDASYANIGEVALNNLREVGIRVRLRPLERAAFFSAYSEKKLKNIVQGASGAFGNVATRAQSFVVKGAPMPTAATLISTHCSPSRRPRWTPRNARSCSIGCNSWCMKRASMRQSGRLAFITGVGRGSGSRGLG